MTGYVCSERKKLKSDERKENIKFCHGAKERLFFLGKGFEI